MGSGMARTAVYLQLCYVLLVYLVKPYNLSKVDFTSHPCPVHMIRKPDLNKERSLFLGMG